MRRIYLKSKPLNIVALFLFLPPMLNPMYGWAFSMQLTPKSKKTPPAPVFSCCDLNEGIISAEGIELAKQLNILPKLIRLENLRKQARLSTSEKLPIDLREDIRDIKEEIMEKIEQTRIEIEYVQAGLAVEIAGQDELLHAYTAERDKRMNSCYLWSFRTNGALWAVAEGLAIPTYSHPRYSISSGTIGIIAGLVPSVFSLIAMHEIGGGHYQREARPNMLSKIFDYPVDAPIEYPKSVWNFLNAAPTKGITTKSRREQLIDRWAQDKYMHAFDEKGSKNELDTLTGAVQNRLTIQSVSDRLAILRQLSAIVAMMNRPLLDIMLVMRGDKALPEQ